MKYKPGDLVYHSLSRADNLLTGIVCGSGKYWAHVKWFNPPRPDLHKCFYRGGDLFVVRKLETHPDYPQ